MINVDARIERVDDGVRIVGVWDSADVVGPGAGGPLRLEVELTEAASSEALERGITTGVLRRVERHLVEMNAEFNATPAVGAYQVMVRRYLTDRLAEMPDGPRAGGDDYYRALLALFDDVVGRGHTAPVAALAAAMGVSKQTVKTRLRTARQRIGGAPKD